MWDKCERERGGRKVYLVAITLIGGTFAGLSGRHNKK